MKTTTNLDIRDQREKGWFWLHDEFVDAYGELTGPYAVAVYAVLCRHSNNETQKCFPSMETIGRKAGIKSRKTVSLAITTLENFNIIKVEKAQGEDGKRLNNIYHLQKPSAWKGHRAAAVARETVSRETPAAAPVKESKKVPEVVLPDWLDKEAWAEWVQYKKERHQTLKPSTIAYQLRILEKNKADHAEMLRQSIANGWTGLYPLKNKFSGPKKVEAKSGKYSHISA